jgi:hypothetical protein
MLKPLFFPHGNLGNLGDIPIIPSLPNMRFRRSSTRLIYRTKMTPTTWPVITVEVQRALEASAMNLLHRFHVIYNMGPMGIAKMGKSRGFF